MKTTKGVLRPHQQVKYSYSFSLHLGQHCGLINAYVKLQQLSGLHNLQLPSLAAGSQMSLSDAQTLQQVLYLVIYISLVMLCLQVFFIYVDDFALFSSLI